MGTTIRTNFSLRLSRLDRSDFYESYEDFKKYVQKEYKTIYGKKEEWASNKVLVNYGKIRILCGFWYSDELLEILVEAKNGKNITMGELMFKIHNETAKVEFFEDADAYLEGIIEEKSKDEIPTYKLDLGT